ncbi:DUF4352 domain-containing protein [Smaragdicoccus niigatensis]|uniref:DUF4352 domain-containing protein n=1 Tax=Smaragdicoccus niigatensis TaxID=359359 RepID=UPI0003A1F8AF|nr:DUF4352 domain-containing protein [Smaragdicoccus niigatensis]
MFSTESSPEGYPPPVQGQPQYAPQGYYVPQPPKKSHKVRNIIIGVLVFFVIAAMAANMGGGSTKQTAAADAGLNTPVRDGSFEFVVTNVERGIGTVGDNPYLQKNAQGAFTIVHLTVKNIGDKPESFVPGSQKVFDAAGREFTNDAAAALNLEAETSLLAEINPGNTVTAAVVFDLPAGSDAKTIELHDSLFSGGVVVKLD